MKKNDENPLDKLKPEIRQDLEKLRQAPSRSPQKTASGRANYIYEAQEIRNAVSMGSKLRHKEWKLIPLQTRKEPFRMSALATILLIVSLVFGGSTATLAAAQAALPDQPLYGLKLASEETRAQLTNQTQSRFELTLQFTNRRMQELQSLVEKGITPPQALLTRYQNQVELALRLAAGMPEEDLAPALLRLQETLRNHEQAMLQLQLQNPSEPALQQLMLMIQTRLQLCQSGLDDPNSFRYQVQTQKGEEFTPQSGQINSDGGENQSGGNPWTEGTPTPGSGYGEGNGSNPWTTGTPTPGSGYGDGSGGNPYTTGTPTPGSGYGDSSGGNPYTTGTPKPGSGYGDGSGGNPYTTGTPTPGSGYGDGSGGNPYTTGTPTPGSGYGPGPQ